MTQEEIGNVEMQVSLETDSELENLARKISAVRRTKDELTKQLDDLKAEEQMIKGRLKELMIAREITKFHINGVGLIYFQSSFYPVVVGDPELLISWLDGHEGSQVAIRNINRSSLKEFYEELLAGDRELPPTDLVKAESIQDVRFRPDHKVILGG